MDGTKKLAIKRSLLAEVKRRRRSQAMLDMIASWEADEGPINRAHLDWADAATSTSTPRRVTIGRRLADTKTFDVVAAHLAVVAESLGTFILTADPGDMSKLNARFESY